jgi:hypothetical protein
MLKYTPRLSPTATINMTFAALLLTLVTLGSITVYESSASQQLLTTPELGSWRSEKSWAQYSPYSPAGKYELLPAGCSINQVNIVRFFRFDH